MTPTRRRALLVLLVVVLLGLLVEAFVRITGVVESPVPEVLFGALVTLAVVGTVALALTSSRRSLARETDEVEDDPLLLEVPPVGPDATDEDATDDPERGPGDGGGAEHDTAPGVTGDERA